MSGLYINTNVSSLVANQNLQRTQARLTDTLTQLSTGYRINSAKDDPAGLIAGELMRSDMVATEAAIRNTARADATLSIAESAMGQISTLLTEARGLAVEAANTGAMSAAQIEANQVQMDAILDSVDRIANTTQLFGNRLIDGSRSAASGGSTFQLGANVNSSGQVNVAIEGMRTTQLGDLYQLRSGGAADLATNPGLAEASLQSALEQVNMQRGSLGATQKYTLGSNTTALQDTLVQTAATEALISNVDFAVAVSNLVRDQILMDVGARVAAIANQSSANAAALLL